VHASHETIYNAIYAYPKGELRKALIQCLRQGRSTRRPRLGGQDRRGQIPDMVSIHLRPPDATADSALVAFTAKLNQIAQGHRRQSIQPPRDPLTCPHPPYQSFRESPGLQGSGVLGCGFR
jgi:IS30 family transposase